MNWNWNWSSSGGLRPVMISKAVKAHQSQKTSTKKSSFTTQRCGQSEEDSTQVYKYTCTKTI